MRFPSIPRPAWLLALTLTVVGCGPDTSSNLSPSSGQDPDRYQRAVRESEEKAHKDQEDERKAFQSKGQPAPNL